MKTFKKLKLENLRIMQGLTKTDLSRRLSCSSMSITNWEKGRQPSPKNLKKLSDYFKIPIPDFF